MISAHNVWRNGVQGAVLHRSNPSPFMSALGHKRTLTDARVMSALPPKADIRTADVVGDGRDEKGPVAVLLR